MKYIVNFSGGDCSFWAAHRTIERHGRDNVVLLFADTLIEDDDLYTFNTQAETLLGVQITRICEGMTPWELFRKEGLIGNDRFPICSTKLKREPLNEWMGSRYEMEDGHENALYEAANCVLGFDWTESHRVRAMQSTHPRWRISAPMTEEPFWDKCRMLAETAKLGLKVPSLYTDGFPHNNCGGFCVKAGISHFVHLYRKRPLMFLRMADEELATQKVLCSRGIDGSFTVLKDRRGGVSKPLSLHSLATRIESGEKFSTIDWGGCGCGGVENAQSKSPTAV